MKKTVLVLTFIFTALISLSQTTWTIPKSEGSARNLTTVNGGFRVPNGIIMGRFADTTAANLTSAKFHDGSVILVGQSLYQRQLSSNRWLLISSVGAGGSSSLQAVVDVNPEVNTGIVYTVNPAPTIPSAGITAFSSGNSKFSLIDNNPNSVDFDLSTMGGISVNLKMPLQSGTLALLSDTASLSSRINLKLNVSDTANMLSPYLRSAIAANSYASSSHLHNTSDITSGTLPIARGGTGLSAIGTVGQSLQVATGGTALEYVNIPSLINTAINLKLNTSDTTSLSNRINTKLNITDTANIRLRPIAGTNITITGTYPNLTINSTGGGGGSTDTTSLSSRINLKLNISDTATMLSPYTITSEVRQVVSDSTREFTVGVGLELTNDTLLSLKEVSPGEIGGVTQDQVDSWDNSEQYLGLPSVNGYVLSSATDGTRSWVAQGGGSTDTTSLSNRINTKQATLVSGTNIKTINGESLLGSSDIVISGGSGIDDNPEIKLLQGLGSQIKAQTFNAVEATTTTGLVDGTARLNPVYLAKGQTITGVEYYQTTQGVYTSDNNNQVALYTVNAATGVLTRVAISNNDGTNIWKQAANVTYKVPFSSPYVASAGVYYIGFLYNTSAQSTQPFILAKSAAQNPAQAALDNTGSLTKSMTAFAQTELATTYTASTLTTAATNPWIAIY
jgi:hypothetical protein